MANPSSPSTPVASAPQPKLKIYFLPNLMTAGNLFCGFVALTKIVEADLTTLKGITDIKWAMGFILLACVFDSLDGRVARWGGVESDFGREFDSLADLISFGAAPAFLVHRFVLHDVFAEYPEIGWFIASIYLICGALRLARFNCMSAMPHQPGDSKDFTGFPIPAAAGMVASVTYFLINYNANQRDFTQVPWRYVLPVIMLFLSFMMVSEVKYPSFKNLNLRTQRKFSRMVIAILCIGVVVILRKHVLPIVVPLMFTIYLLYGFIRPRISGKVRNEIEEEDVDEDDEEGASK
jgi:CDP-diacylglycerol--serine O-phosphatidyltransferase